MTESQEQRQLIQWCRTDPKFQYLFHIPNESVGGQGWIIRNRQLGVKAGVPDLFYPVPMHGYHGLFIEMKRERGSYASEEQMIWLTNLRLEGYMAMVCRGYEHARNVIEEYLR